MKSPLDELFETPFHTDHDEDQLIQDLLVMGTRAVELENRTKPKQHPGPRR